MRDSAAAIIRACLVLAIAARTSKPPMIVKIKYATNPSMRLCVTNRLPGRYEHVNGMRRQSSSTTCTNTSPTRATMAAAITAGDPRAIQKTGIAAATGTPTT